MISWLKLRVAEGKWFAAAKDAGLYREAIELANRTPCDPKTLIRAARDLTEANPQFAVEAGMAALRWLVSGYGYEITGLDVWSAYRHTMSAAERAGCKAQVFERVRRLVEGDRQADRFVSKILGSELNLNPPGAAKPQPKRLTAETQRNAEKNRDTDER